MTTAVAAGLVFGAWAEEARACAGLVHEAEALAESDAAEAVFEVGVGEIAVTYDVTYKGDAADFGWVIPVPGDVSAIEDGDAGLVEDVRSVSQPLVYQESGEEPSSGGCGGCGAAMSDKGGSLSNDQSVTIVAEGFTGTYDYLVVTATDATALQTWFTDNGWEGIAQEDLDHYVADGANFAAIRVAPDVAMTPGTGRHLPPLRIRYAGDTIRFPAVMARHASVQSQRTTLYVLGDTRAAIVDGWGMDDTHELRGGANEDPAQIFDNLLVTVAADRAYVRTYAGDYGDRFLTRFDTNARSDVHTDDVDLALEDSTEAFSFRIDLDPPVTIQYDAVPVGLILFGVGAGVRRRRQG